MVIDVEKLLMKIDTLNEYLTHRVMEVDFVKKDGTNRTMRCTKNLLLIPKEFHPKPLAEGEIRANTDPQLFKVFDLDINAWRSFRYSTIQQVRLSTPAGV